jgi:hypothetical protein
MGAFGPRWATAINAKGLSCIEQRTKDESTCGTDTQDHYTHSTLQQLTVFQWVTAHQPARHTHQSLEEPDHTPSRKCVAECPQTLRPGPACSDQDLRGTIPETAQLCKRFLVTRGDFPQNVERSWVKRVKLRRPPRFAADWSISEADPPAGIPQGRCAAPPPLAHP